jgi:hypothetical protein
MSVRTEGSDVTAGLAKVTDGSDLIAFDGNKMVSKQDAEKKLQLFKLNPTGKAEGSAMVWCHAPSIVSRQPWCSCSVA